MKQIINFETWERKDNFLFFKSFVDPNMSITSEVKCNEAKEISHQKGESFFLYYLYAILRAANEIKEFRYRIAGEEIVLHDKVDVLTPIKKKTKEEFYTVRIPYIENFTTFYETAHAIIRDIPEDGNPYETDNSGLDAEAFDVILVSAMPQLHFTSMTMTQKNIGGNPYPLLNVGKAVFREKDLCIPIAL